MAEDDSSQEKTEEPTARRLEKAREEGQVPRSRELTTTAILLAGTIGLYIFSGSMGSTLLGILKHNFSFSREVAFDPQLMIWQLEAGIAEGLLMLIPLFSILLIVSILGPIALGGWLFSTKAMAPKLNRMDPIAGLKRMFSVKALVELAKALGKVLIILTVGLFLLQFMRDDILNLSTESIESSIIHSLELSGWAAILLSAVTILIAIADVPFQIWDNTRKLKMSRQDIKDEMKDSEGKPEVKSRIRQLQREMANNRMMAEVPKADVIITNPTHYSVALKYDPEVMATPIMIAKGVDFNALKIREIANAYEIEIVEAPVLARAVYHTTEIDQEIPSGLYLAVAQVLAYVFQLKSYAKQGGKKPKMPTEFPVPEDMRFDE
ncbi:flagellar biosynthesis protein FlhB [Marinibactrum halimedae]|uniref:Flagellar biosynthetic protein FlhB n=1 Tax=Marinibactrum halimedae TaxID=1444977 RepID=A0AA37T8W0_9GAMM|nr:flagellar biosynthesis protein FlhB [Marinibactrum halimedae]MCD9459145.1 flagellar type III secretion system protein FlhB [Marinibactrum halimedae]GLS24747.1 flagellar biosynthesis protein FlhB [Marinibactrum halimedae]